MAPTKEMTQTLEGIRSGLKNLTKITEDALGKEKRKTSSGSMGRKFFGLMLLITSITVCVYLSGGILRLHQRLRGGQLGSDMDNYSSLYDESGVRDVSKRKSSYGDIVPNFYRLVTDFYEYGWGESFHFAPRSKSETFEASLSRHEHFLGLMANLRPGMKVLDIGAGIGGPMREIARLTGATIIGLNIVDYQIERGNELNRHYGLDKLCSFQKGDFHHLPFEDETFDAVISIEAICHTLDKSRVYSEVNRVLKKGGRFAFYDWVMTKSFDPSNAMHNKIKEGIEVGNALPDIMNWDVVRPQLEGAGLRVLEEQDVSIPSEIFPIPWWAPLGRSFSFSLRGVANSYYSRIITNQVLWLMERLGVVEKGSHYAAVLLHTTALDLVAGGETGIFSPSYFALSIKE